MDDLQSWWEVPSIAHFCSLFRVAFNLLDFDIEELEEALLTDGVEISGSTLLQELIVRLLSGCFINNGISVSNYQMYLRRLFRTRCKEQGRKNPFNSDVDFQCLPLRTKVEILHALCDFRLDAEDVVDVLKNLDSDSLRVHPLGYDSLKSAYWYFYGTRLYREDFPKRKKRRVKDEGKGKRKGGLSSDDGEDSSDNGGTVGKWQVICYTEADWERVTKSFSHSNSKEEQALYSVLSDDFLPEIPRLFAEKERLQRKRMAESAQRRTSSRIEKLKKQAQEDESKRMEQEAIAVREQEEREKMRRLKRERKRRERRARHRSVSFSDDSSDNSLQDRPSGGGSVGGRQTNNSLASATGQIYIQQSKQKVSTSHLFRRTREDLMTGLYKVLDKLKTHPDAWPFADPVEEQYAPRYYSVIARPMDLQTMEDKLDNGEYGSLQQFREDFQLIVDNCRQYNGSDNDYTRMANRLLNTFMNLIDKYLEAEGSTQDEDSDGNKRIRRSRHTSELDSDDDLSDVRDRVRSEDKSGDDKDHRGRRQLKKGSEGESEEENRDPRSRGPKRKSSKENVDILPARPAPHRGRPRKRREVEIYDDDDSERETLVERNRREDRMKPIPPPSPSNSTQSLRSRSEGLSDTDGSVTSLSSKSFKDEDWKQSRYNYTKKDKLKNNKYMGTKSRLRKRMRRKDRIEQVKRPPQCDEERERRDRNVKPSYDSELDDLDDSDERLSILDNVETSGSEEILDTSDEESDEDSDEDHYDRKHKKIIKKTIKKTTVIRTQATLEELEQVTEQVLKDITKWLDEAPRFSDFSSNSNSPLHIPFPEEMANMDPEMKRKYHHHHHHSEKHVRPRDRFTNDLHRRKMLREQVLKRQRTIDRLQPGKSKGNLLSKENLQEKESKEGATDTTATAEKEGNAPKLSLGKVLATDLLGFGMGETEKKETEEEVEEKDKKEKEEVVEELKEEIKEEKVKEEEIEVPSKEPEVQEEEKKAEPEKIETKKEKPTPNLSAWFKAFGAPKSQAAVTKKKPDSEEKTDSKGKEDESTNEDDKDKNCMQSPARRQRRTSTGSSVSERSSFSQDQFDGNSPRPSIDEPYLSPQPEMKSYHHSPINGTIKVGFYQDTCFPKGSSEKSSSPRDVGSSPRDIASVSPRTPYVSPRNTPHSTSPRDLTSSPRDYQGASPHHQYPSYNSVPAFHPSYQSVPRYPPHIPYYDASSKPVVEQQQFTKNDKSQLSMYPVKKRGYNEVEQTPKTPEPPPTSAFKSGSFTPTKEAVERERTFAPTPGRMPNQSIRIPDSGLLPSHLHLMEAYQHPEDRRYIGGESIYSKSPAPPTVYSQNNYSREQQNYDNVQNYNRVLSPFHAASRADNHFPPEHKTNSREPLSPDHAPLNFSNSSEQSKKDDYPPRVPSGAESPLDYGKPSELLNPKSNQSSLPYPVNRLNEVPAKVNSPYNRGVSELSRPIDYQSESDIKMGLYKNQTELMAGKNIYNHPMDLMQGSARYNYQMELGKSVYNHQAMQLELMQGKSSPYIVQGGLYNRPETTTAKPAEHKEPEYTCKSEPKVKKSRKKKNEVPSNYQQYSQDPKPTGSAFNFGPPIKDNYTSYLEEMRAGASYYAQQDSGANAKQPGSYFLRPPTTSYAPHPFINAQYQQLLHRHPEELLRPMMLHQSLLPPTSYPPGYLPMHDAINRPSWL